MNNNVTKRRNATSQKRKEIDTDEEWNQAALSIPCGEFEKGKEKEVFVPDSQPSASPDMYADQDSLEIESDSSSSDSEKEKEPPKKKAKVLNVKFAEEELPATDFPLKKRSVKKKEFRLQALRLFLTYPQCSLSPEEGFEELKKILGDPEEYIVAQEDHKVKI